MGRSHHFAATLAVGLAVVVAGCGSDSSSSDDSSSSSNASKTDNITIGAVCDLSGALKAFGDTCKGTLNMAVDEINQAGGINVGGTKYQVKLDVQDGGSDPAKAVAATRSLLSQGTKVLFGPDASPTALQVAAVTQNADVLNIGAASALHAALGKGKKMIFDTIPQDSNWIGGIVDDLKLMGIPSGKVVIVYPDDQTGEAVVPNVTKILQDGGYTPDKVTYPADTLDFRSVATKVKGKNPDAVLIGYTLARNLPLARALVEQQATPAITAVNSTPTEVPKVIEKETGKPLGIKWGSLGVGPNFATPTSPKVAELAQKVESQLKLDPHTTPATLSTWWYDYVFLVKQAMEKAGSVDNPEKIAAALRTLKCTDCVLNNLHFAPDQSAVFASDVGTYIDGKEEWKSIEPKT